MVLIDRKILLGGIAMIIVGTILTLYLNQSMPVGVSGMTDEEAIDIILKQRENQDFTTLAGILIGVGFLLVLISFGARRKRPGSAKKTEKKPAQQ